MRKFALLLLLGMAYATSAQQQVQPVAGVLTLSLAPGNNSFKVIVGANITSVTFTNPTPGTTATVIFTENATGGFTGLGNLTPSCSVTINDSGTVWNSQAVAHVNTQSTTAPLFNFSNNAVALTVSSTYRIDYLCGPR